MRDGAAGNATVSARRVPSACTGLMPITIVMAFSWPRISVSDAPVSVAIVIWKRVSLASQGRTCDREPHHVVRLCRFKLCDDILELLAVAFRSDESLEAALALGDDVLDAFTQNCYVPG